MWDHLITYLRICCEQVKVMTTSLCAISAGVPPVQWLTLTVWDMASYLHNALSLTFVWLNPYSTPCWGYSIVPCAIWYPYTTTWRGQYLHMISGYPYQGIRTAGTHKRMSFNTKSLIFWSGKTRCVFLAFGLNAWAHIHSSNTQVICKSFTRPEEKKKLWPGQKRIPLLDLWYFKNKPGIKH